ncbi:MAG TPA: FliA/WhiG family RNA polymerase sigma factor [Nitrospinota bacterium]|nr:FliA/WhiG family RNA polymerase sigma factor [Nitrospinota bacterium]
MAKILQKKLKEKYEYKEPSVKEQLILKYAPMIKYIAQRIAARLPSHVDINDLISSGVIGLIDALEKFNPERDIQFKTYAEFRIKGAILDDLRSLDWIPRSVRQKINRLEKVYSNLEQKLGRAATDEEVAKSLSIGLEDLHQILNKARGVSLISKESLGRNLSEDERVNLIESLSGSRKMDPSLLLKTKQIKEITAKAIDQLPEKERQVVSLYYYEELTMKEIGKVLDITESRVSQIHTRAMLRLRGKLKKTLEVEE